MVKRGASMKLHNRIIDYLGTLVVTIGDCAGEQFTVLPGRRNLSKAYGGRVARVTLLSAPGVDRGKAGWLRGLLRLVWTRTARYIYGGGSVSLQRHPSHRARRLYLRKCWNSCGRNTVLTCREIPGAWQTVKIHGNPGTPAHWFTGASDRQ